MAAEVVDEATVDAKVDAAVTAVTEESQKQTDVAYVDTAHFLNALVDLLVRKGWLRQADVDELNRTVMEATPPEYFKSKAGLYDDAKSNAATVEATPVDTK